MRHLPIECLRSFATVSEVRGFTQAGQILGLTQPAVSLQIKRLEERIGAPVFVRGGSRLDLTPTGARLMDYARQILALNDEALSELSTPVISGRVQLGTWQSITLVDPNVDNPRRSVRVSFLPA